MTHFSKTIKTKKQTTKTALSCGLSNFWQWLPEVKKGGIFLPRRHKSKETLPKIPKYFVLSTEHAEYLEQIKKEHHLKYEIEALETILDEHKNFIIMNTGPCNMLIKRSLLKKINFKFPAKIIYEDLAVIPSLAFYNVNIKLVEKSYYNYYIRSGSSMNKKKYNKKLNDIFISINNLYDIWCKIDKERKYYSEIEFIFIRRLLMSASLRFIEFNDPDNSINKISDVIKEKFPNWEKNKYYNKLNFKQKIVGIFTYKKMKKMLYLCYNVNRKFGGRNG